MFFLTNVPVANRIEVQVPIVVSDDFADLLTVLMDLTPSEVLLAESVSMILVEGCDIVRLVLEGHFSYQLMTHRTNEDAIKVVIVLIPANLSAISEFDLLVSVALDSAILQTKVDLILEPSGHFIV